MLFKTIKEGSGGGEVHKTIWIKEGESLNGVFKGDEHEFKIHWVESTPGGSKKKRTCPGKDCELCEAGLKANYQFRVNFIHKGEDGFQTDFYEGDWFTHERLYKFNAQHPLEETLVKIYKGTEGKYKVDLFEKVRKLEKAQLDIINTIPLLDVVTGQVKQEQHQEQEQGTSFEDF